MTLGYRLIIGLMAVIAAIIMVRLVESSTVQSAEPCVSVSDMNHLRDLTVAGIDQGFKEQVTHLFTVWMADSSEQPRRAMVGMSNALSAYDRARKNTLAWDPPRCKQ